MVVRGALVPTTDDRTGMYADDVTSPHGIGKSSGYIVACALCECGSHVSLTIMPGLPPPSVRDSVITRPSLLSSPSITAPGLSSLCTLAGIKSSLCTLAGIKVQVLKGKNERLHLEQEELKAELASPSPLTLPDSVMLQPAVQPVLLD